MKYTCPACGHKVFSEPPGSDEICPVCFWEDDLSQLRFVTTTGANHVSLVEAQKNYKTFGAVEEKLYEQVRAAEILEEIDPTWREFDETRDMVEMPIQGKDYGGTYPADTTTLYYWRK